MRRRDVDDAARRAARVVLQAACERCAAVHRDCAFSGRNKACNAPSAAAAYAGAVMAPRQTAGALLTDTTMTTARAIASATGTTLIAIVRPVCTTSAPPDDTTVDQPQKDFVRPFAEATARVSTVHSDANALAQPQERDADQAADDHVKRCRDDRRRLDELLECAQNAQVEAVVAVPRPCAHDGDTQPACEVADDAEHEECAEDCAAT